MTPVDGELVVWKPAGGQPGPFGTLRKSTWLVAFLAGSSHGRGRAGGRRPWRPGNGRGAVTGAVAAAGAAACSRSASDLGRAPRPGSADPPTERARRSLVQGWSSSRSFWAWTSRSTCATDRRREARQAIGAEKARRGRSASTCRPAWIVSDLRRSTPRSAPDDGRRELLWSGHVAEERERSTATVHWAWRRSAITLTSPPCGTNSASSSQRAATASSDGHTPSARPAR